MYVSVQKKQPVGVVMQDPHAVLERMYIEDYLRSKGTTRRGLKALPKDLANQWMIEASIFASVKLAEAETRAKLLEELQGMT